MKFIPLRVLALVAMPTLIACASTAPNDSGKNGGAGAKGGSGGTSSGNTGGSSSGSGGSSGGSTGGSSGGSDTGSGPPAACGTCTCPGEMVKNAVVSDFNDLASGYKGLDAKALTNASNWTLDKDQSATCTATLVAEDSTDGTQKGAAHFSGSKCTSWGADIALSFGTTPADATSYTGLSFKIKGGSTNMASTVLFKIELADAVPACGLCTKAKPDMSDCYAGYVLDGNMVTSEWKTITVPFSSMKVAQWGYHEGTSFDPSQLFALSIAVAQGPTWDLWIDDFQFVK